MEFPLSVYIGVIVWLGCMIIGFLVISVWLLHAKPNIGDATHHEQAMGVHDEVALTVGIHIASCCRIHQRGLGVDTCVATCGSCLGGVPG